MGEAAPTPFVFRNRSLLIGLAMFLSVALSRLLAPLAQGPGWDATALDPRLRIGAQLPVAGAPFEQLAAPSLLFLAGFLLRAWGTSYLRGHVMLDKALHTDRLIVAGPFRWVRNPLYLGNLLFAAGFGLYLPPPGLLVSVAAMATPLAFVADAEERALRLRFGKEYDAYAARVAAFVPKPPPRDLPAGSEVEPAWANGLLTECWMLLVGTYFALAALRMQTAALILLTVLVVVAFGGRLLVRRSALP